MHQDLSRNLNILVWQNIDWKNLTQYLDNLKSRIYKASIEKSYKKIHGLQFKLIHSNIVKLLAFKHVLHEYRYMIPLTAFQLGCWVSYLSIEADLSQYFIDNIFINSSKETRLIFDKVKNLIIIWSVESYCKSLYHLNKRSLLHFFTNYSYKYNFNSYCLQLSIASLLYHVNLAVFINRIHVLSSIKKYLYTFLQNGMFILLMNFLLRCNQLYALKKPAIILLNILIDIFMLTMCYEIHSILKSQLSYKYNIFFSIDHSLKVFIYCDNIEQLKYWQQAFIDLVISNGVKIKEIKSLEKNFLLYYIRTSYKLINLLAYSWNISLKPSLNCQYLLLRQLFILLKKSRSKALFLLIIRLNKLLLSWSMLYHAQGVYKLFSLLDYVIYLKLKLFIQKKHSSWSNQKIRYQYFPLRVYRFNNFTINTSWICVNNIWCSNYYRIYYTIKLFWFTL